MLPGTVRIAVFLSALGLIAPACAAARDWDPVVQVSETGKHVAFPEVGLDSSGNALAIWMGLEGLTGNEEHRIRVAARAAGASWVRTTNPLSGIRARAPALGVSANGSALAAWYESDAPSSNGVAWAAAGSTSGTFAAPSQLSGVSHNAIGTIFSAALNAGGTGAVAWETDTTSDRVLAARTMTAGTLAGANASIPSNLSQQSGSFHEPRVAAASNGAIIAFDQWSTTTFNTRPRAIGGTSGGDLTTGSFLNPGGESGSPPAFPSIGVMPDGSLAMAWVHGQRVYARVGTSETPQALSPASPATVPGIPPALAVGPDGTVAVAWRQDDSGGTDDVHVWAATRPAGAASFEGADQLSESADFGSQFDGPLVGFAGNEAIVAWSRDDGLYDRVEVSVRPQGGSFDALSEQLSGAFDGSEGDAHSPSLGTNAAGQTVIVWAQQFSGHGRLLSTRSGPSPTGGGPTGGGPTGGGPTGGAPAGGGPSGGGPTVTTPARDTTKPVASRFRPSRSRFAKGRREGALAVPKEGKTVAYPRGQKRQNLLVGTKFLFLSTEAGRAAITIKGVGCQRFLPVGDPLRRSPFRCGSRDDRATARGAVKRGANSIRFLGGGLTPGGLYQATLKVTDAAGNASKPVTKTFVIDGPFG